MCQIVSEDTWLSIEGSLFLGHPTLCTHAIFNKPRYSQSVFCIQKPRKNSKTNIFLPEIDRFKFEMTILRILPIAYIHYFDINYNFLTKFFANFFLPYDTSQVVKLQIFHFFLNFFLSVSCINLKTLKYAIKRALIWSP